MPLDMSSSEAKTALLPAVTATPQKLCDWWPVQWENEPTLIAVWSTTCAPSLLWSSQVLGNSLSSKAAHDFVDLYHFLCRKMWLLVVLLFCFPITVYNKCLDLSLYYIYSISYIIHALLTYAYYIHFCSDFYLFFKQYSFPITAP